jgi:hypothetical protein
MEGMGGEMAPTMYAHMNKWINNRKDNLRNQIQDLDNKDSNMDKKFNKEIEIMKKNKYKLWK